LPTEFIAGKMMLVRALVIGLKIDCIAPSATPEIDLNRHYDFCAMIPLQLQSSLSKCENVKTVIVGGAPMSSSLKKSVQSLKTRVFETYGMTETITHIAVKQINNTSKEIATSNYFELLPGVSMNQDHRNCLVIHAPKISEDPIVTNDIVTMISTSLFEWIGRMDTIINSGGIKISPEHIESKLESHISKRFFIASQADEFLGERLILVLESESNTLTSDVFNSLEKHQRPKEIYVVSKFIETSTGKIQRKKTLATLKL
jgi:O-succinylbenzoic acid--CoA ligase